MPDDRSGPPSGPTAGHDTSAGPPPAPPPVPSDDDWWTPLDDAWVPPVADTGAISAARIVDHLSGGRDHFATDGAAAAHLLAEAPDVPTTLRANRAFVTRAVTRMVTEHGIRQFIDLGTGLPALPSVHETACALTPEARVVYVDLDPVVLARCRALLRDGDSTAVLAGDLRAPAELLGHPTTRDHLDLAHPVGLVMSCVPHFVAVEQAPWIMAQYRRSLAPGSGLAASAFCRTGSRTPALLAAQALFGNTTTPLHPRTAAQFEQLFEDFPLVAPLSDVTAHSPGTPGPPSLPMLCGIGIRP